MARPSVITPLLLLTGLTTACERFRDLFSAHADIAAQAGQLELTPQRLGEIMAGAKGIRPNRESAEFVANTWVDYALFAQAVADNKLPLDSTSVAQALWPQLAELRGSHWHDTLMARRSVITPTSVDSLYQGDQVRVLQHILFRVPPNAVPEVRDVARKKAEGTLARIKRGADFGKVASQLSEDPGSKQDRGFLPPSPKGRFVPAFDSAGWRLSPGGVSGVVETPFGYHIIKRPAEAAVRERLTAYLTQSRGARLDSMYMDSLAIMNQVTVLKGAASAMRAAAEDPEKARRSQKKLATFKGGELTVAEFMRWLRALPPQYTTQLRQAHDTMLTQFAKVLSQNILLLRQADSAKINVTGDEWSAIETAYRSQIDTLKKDMGLDSAKLGDSSASVVERHRMAEMKVDQYFDRLVSGQSRLRPLPTGLAASLRDRYQYRIQAAGLNRGVELAQAERAKTDTTQARSGQMQPAPGPAPIPGVTPGDTSAAARGQAPQPRESTPQRSGQ